MIVWIAVNDSSDHSDPRNLVQICTNDPSDCNYQNRWDKTLHYSSDCSDPVARVMRFFVITFINQDGR